MARPTYAQFREQFPPSCPMGYTREDLQKYFGAVEGEAHPLWTQLNGQTGAICNGQLYSYENEEYFPSPCADNPHGFISYTHDVYEYWAGLPVSDW